MMLFVRVSTDNRKSSSVAPSDTAPVSVRIGRCTWLADVPPPKPP